MSQPVSFFDPASFRHQRERSDLTREDAVFALRQRGLEFSVRTLAKYESGETSPDAADLPHFADLYGCKINDFYKAQNGKTK